MRKTILSAAVAFVLAGTGLIVMTSSSGAAVGDVPADCVVSTAAYRSDGQRLTYQFHGNSDPKTKIEAIEGDTRGWVPTALHLGGVWSESSDSFHREEFATHPTNGYIYRLDRAAERTDGVWRMTKNTATRLTAGFGGTRILAYGYPYLYRVTGKSLYRYLVVGDGIPVDPVKMPGSAWDTVKTLIYERKGGTDTAPVGVLIGTKTNGELKEWRIKESSPPPTTIPSTVLRSAGWGGFTSLSTGSCENHPNGRALLAIKAAGSASVHFDASAKDWDGTDITGGSLGSLGWTAKAYGQ